MKAKTAKKIALFFFCSVAFGDPIASQQPLGTLVETWHTTGALPLPPIPIPVGYPPLLPYPPTTPVGEVNYICGQWDTNVTEASYPFDLNYGVTEVIVAAQHFVRLFDTVSGSTKNGSWIMPSSQVRGLTAAQLRDRFALPSIPNSIVNVDLSDSPSAPKQNALWTGIAGPIAGWGNGGGIQNKIISDYKNRGAPTPPIPWTTYFPNYAFFLGTRDHPQLLTEYALSYKPLAGKGNRGNIAAYLDNFIPTPYSDLDTVFTDLDYLNWTGYGAGPLQDALNQLSSEGYNSMPFVVIRNSFLYQQTLLDRIFAATQCQEACIKCQRPFLCKAPFALQFIGEVGKQNESYNSEGFHYQTGGGIAYGDFAPGKDSLLGFGFMTAANHIDLDDGSIHFQTTKLGTYFTYFPSCFFIGLTATGGYNFGHSSRDISFYGVDRKAKASPKGFDAAASLQSGYNIPYKCFLFSPIFRASYFGAYQKRFTEQDANSLDLEVDSFDNQLVRSYIGAYSSYAFKHFNPYLQMGWGYDFLLNHRSISARLHDVEATRLGSQESFSVRSFHRNLNIFLLTAGVRIVVKQYFDLLLNYDLENRKYFTSHTLKFSCRFTY